MSNVAFNTHSFVKRLTEVGMPEEQAEVLADSYATLIDEKLASKWDVKELAAANKRDLEQWAVATRRDMKELAAANKRDLEQLAVATKRDMKELAAANKRDLEQLAVATKRDMKELELRLRHDLTLRLGSMMVAAVGAVAVLSRLL